MVCTPQPDFYCGEDYIRAASMLEPDGVLRVFRFGRAVVPLIAKPLPKECGPGFDAISPYDFCGPRLNGEAADRVWPALCAWASEQGILAAFFRFHPFHGEPEAWHGFDGLEIAQSAQNVVIELNDADTMLSACKSTVPRDLKVAERAGVTCEFFPISPEGLDGFVPLYLQTMDHLEAAEFYRFPRAFFDTLAAELRDSCVLATARRDGRVVGSSLILLDGTTAYYYLACSSDMGRKLCAMNMLVFEAACRLRKMGFEWFHLGGGSPSLLAFKERFGPGRVPYFVGRAIFDQPRYRYLTRGVQTDFFPAYRGTGRAGGG